MFFRKSSTAPLSPSTKVVRNCSELLVIASMICPACCPNRWHRSRIARNVSTACCHVVGVFGVREMTWYGGEVWVICPAASLNWTITDTEISRSFGYPPTDRSGDVEKFLVWDRWSKLFSHRENSSTS